SATPRSCLVPTPRFSYAQPLVVQRQSVLGHVERLATDRRVGVGGARLRDERRDISLPFPPVQILGNCNARDFRSGYALTPRFLGELGLELVGQPQTQTSQWPSPRRVLCDIMHYKTRCGHSHVMHVPVAGATWS